MISRDKVLSDALNKCLKELYSYAQPSVDWESLIEENKEFVKKEEEWKSLPEETRPSYKEYCGPKPYEFYYLPKEILDEIVEDYVYAYKLNDKQNLLDIITILKNYCEQPIIVSKLNAKGYEHPNNLETVIHNYLDLVLADKKNIPNYEELSKTICKKFFDFLDMAGKFYNWNREINTFYTNTYLGGSPNSNKEAVIQNWKKYRGKDITINDLTIDDLYDNF